MNHVIHIEPGTLRIQGGEIATYVSRTADVVDAETKIPPDAKVAVKDFINEVLQNTTDLATELIIDIPESLSEFTEIIIDLIKVIIGV